jgi:FkbM family methyltransferase
MRDPFWKRKLKQIGKKFEYNLIDSNISAEIFPIILSNISRNRKSPTNQDQAFLYFAIDNFDKSKSQICQDLLVLFLTKSKNNGYFVEFGATNGITLSNTYLLEKDYHWSGILAEPAKGWFNQLNKNRNCSIDNRCVWSSTGQKLNFHESDVGELSSIKNYSDNDGHADARAPGTDYFVESISLNDLLITHNAPKVIDYLSIDTEGSEFEILEKFDYENYKINIITVEHNYTNSREKIYSLLKSKNYSRIFEGFSQWDDWYIRNDCINFQKK